MNKLPIVLGVLGCVMSVACGDDQSRDDHAVLDNPAYGQVRKVLDNPAYEIAGKALDNPAYGNVNKVLDNPAYEIAGNVGTNPLYRGATREDVYNTRFEYTLHGTDADINGWLQAGDVIMERSAAGELTYAVVRTVAERNVPTSLVP